jgi:hypothetical protein
MYTPWTRWFEGPGKIGDLYGLAASFIIYFIILSVFSLTGFFVFGIKGDFLKIRENIVVFK